MKNHLIVAGTGRAGTSFLVQFLTACQLETHLSRNPGSKLDEHANAGLEDVLAVDGDFPYVVKSPWLYEFIDDLLGRDDIKIDAVIMPMRDIVEAASSRITVELRGRLGAVGAHEEYTTWETWASTPGGVVYSLNPLDQARILAMGFHRVVHALVRKNIPIIFLDFPRLIEDGEYLYERLRPIIGHMVSPATAMRAHRETAKPDLVRIAAEISGEKAQPSVSVGENFPPFQVLDRAALFRELQRTQAALKSREVELHALNSRYATELNERKQLLEKLADSESKERILAQELEAIRIARSSMSEKLAEVQEQVSKLQSANFGLSEQLARCSAVLNEVLSSTTWRATYLIRAMLGLVSRRNQR
ncbi:TPA: hypothetical protein SAP37_005276 [Burkholderia multivorans]|nr:hypothetical protein [Burkholderia multivorans]HEF4827438.1 hypothetical protein [Burkholderia multivorans]